MTLFEEKGVGGVEEAHGWMERFLAMREAQGLSMSTVNADRCSLEILDAWRRWQGIDVSSMTRAHLLLFLEAFRRSPVRTGRRRGQTKRAGTVVAVVRTLKVWFRYLCDENVILINPLETIRARPDRPLCGLGVLSRSEMESVFKSLEGDEPLMLRDRALAAVFYGVGLRVSEASRLDLSHYNPDERLLWVRQGKGRKDRCLPLSACAAEDLDRYLQRGRPWFARRKCPPAIFLNSQGTRLGTEGMRMRLKRAQKRAGLETLRGPHAFRHSFATHLLSAGASTVHLQRFLGHARIETTARYTAVSLDEMRETLEDVHPRRRMGDA